MKTIACVNVSIPTVDDELSYRSTASLRDYDVIVFDPAMPWYHRTEFSAGGSCISIEDSREFAKNSAHWSRELRDALAAGKTVFVVLSDCRDDSVATGVTSGARNVTNYATQPVNNYSVIPVELNVKNAHGKHIVVKDASYAGLHDALIDVAHYRVVLDPSKLTKVTFAAKDGTPVGGVVRFKEWKGAMVLLPYFDFNVPKYVERRGGSSAAWTNQALQSSHAFVGQIVAIDKALRSSLDLTTPPDWLNAIERPLVVCQIEQEVEEVSREISQLENRRAELEAKKSDLLEYSHLLYEAGKPLEGAIEKTLRLLGYSVETIRVGDLEIDHVIVGPGGRRMIGESEGKENSAIDISKFRQLESNIGEDFEREDIDEPAKGLLFGNGFRLTDPKSRSDQFTKKSLTNARRLGSALVCTADLYPVAVHLLNHPSDEAFRLACREAIENTIGDVVVFPSPQRV